MKTWTVRGRSVTSMKRLTLFCVASVLYLWTTHAQATPITGLFNTGVDGSGSPLPFGSVDPHYSLISSADSVFTGPAAYVANPIPGSWVGNDSASQWIGPAKNQALDSSGLNLANGNYDYRFTFNLTGLNPNTAGISGSWAADNGGTILLNGAATSISIGPQFGYSALSSFSLNSGFVSGINILDFVVTNCCPATINGVMVNPTGLRVDNLTGSAAAVPEPSSLLLLGSGLAALGAWRRKVFKTHLRRGSSQRQSL